MISVIEIDNLKCSGCANTIRKSLGAIPGVMVLEVDPETEKVTLDAETDLHIDQAKNKLRELGYPEKGTLTGINSVAAEAKSYVSCMIGKLSKKD